MIDADTSERGARVRIEWEVPFHDVDPLQVVWHGHYYKYMELARTALQRAHDIDVPQLEALGVRLFVYESRCRHTYPLRLGERLVVEAWFRTVSVRPEIQYKIHNLSQQRGAARASTAMAFTDDQGVMLTELPDELARRLNFDRPN